MINAQSSQSSLIPLLYPGAKFATRCAAWESEEGHVLLAVVMSL